MNEYLMNQSNNDPLQLTQTVFIRKEKEIEYDQKIAHQWRDARSNFYNKQIEEKLSHSKISKKRKAKIIQCFLDDQTQLDIEMIQELLQQQNYEVIYQLKGSLQSIKKQFSKKEKICLPINQITQNKLTNLKLIHIQYQLKVNQQYQYLQRYSVSAFELFKIISQNKMLKQVTLKGVKVQQFQEFMSLWNRTQHNDKHQQQDIINFAWMKDFSLSKTLQLSINAYLTFEINEDDDTLAKINNLNSFCETVCLVSELTIQIRLQQWNKINEWTYVLETLLKCLKKINQIKLKIQAYEHYNTINYMNVSAVRANFFGELASFTKITQLEFYSISFSGQVSINDFLPIEQSLRTLFQHNALTDLKLFFCSNFPVLTKIPLKSIQICRTFFRKQYNLLKDVVEDNLNLRSVKYFWMYLQRNLQWVLKQQIFNQLQSINTQPIQVQHGPQGILFDNFSQSISNIKYLRLQASNIRGNNNCLSTIFSKLVNIVRLGLSHIDVGHQILCIIPSNVLEALTMFQNNLLANHDLEMIDLRWPQLSYIMLQQCQNINQKFWKNCKFKGLMQLQANKRLLGKSNQTLKYLKSRGIKVNY